ncbi:NFATC2-interacting protein isoform X2 [Protopterus annectens]|uniref:NFATC2-interacting protein isoform X2 n=1 Tax=Protopterus annectens TaxID=7888 RepID=UPI001CFAD790|nr:NFATC2-interacting protein isoform X2 [Protopterus annectens]
MAAAQNDDSSDSDIEFVPSKPRILPPKRRRIIDQSTVASVPIYSSKVNQSLHLFSNKLESSNLETEPNIQCAEKETNIQSAEPDQVKDNEPEPAERAEVSFTSPKLSDSEEEVEKHETPPIPARDRSPSPPPALSVVRNTRSRGYMKKIREMDKTLKDLGAAISPKKGSQDEDFDDDVIILTSPTDCDTPQEITVKVRCHADLFRFPLTMADPLQKVVDHMARKLNVCSSRLILFLRDVELNPSETLQHHNVSITDIIDCIEVTEPATQNCINLRVQGKDKNSMQVIGVQKTEPLKNLMDKYKQLMDLKWKKVVFYFDGQELSPKSTAQDHDMETDDVIEAWV